MNKYDVYTTEPFLKVFRVEAESEDEAKEKVLKGELEPLTKRSGGLQVDEVCLCEDDEEDDTDEDDDDIDEEDDEDY